LILIFLPAHHNGSIDAKLWPKIKADQVPAWTINILILQLTIVYTFAGIAKLNSDWLFEAMPLAIWLPEHTGLPIIGYFFQFKWVAFIFSWFGAFYDLTIAYFLMNKKTRNLAYLMVVIFHSLTWLLFNIGLFPLIMMSATLIFFPATFHLRLLSFLGLEKKTNTTYKFSSFSKKILTPLFISFFIIQLILPLRHFLYPGNILWTEEAYRFSWRVMLVEKSGLATFKIKDVERNRKTEIINGQYLTQFQEKQMSIQPDFILQFAHFLKQEYQQKHGIEHPVITVDAYVALNGRTSQLLIDPSVNLAEIEDSFAPKNWILPLEK